MTVSPKVWKQRRRGICARTARESVESAASPTVSVSNEMAASWAQNTGAGEIKASVRLIF